jgi:hypothetical protein
MDRLEAIFEKQRSHMEKYALIEKENGLLQTDRIPVVMNDRYGQARLKDFAWRTSEELGEALDSFDNEAAYGEELSDVTHFLTELTILSGLSADDLVCGGDSIQGADLLLLLFAEAAKDIPTGVKREYGTAVYYTGIVLKELAMTMNCLKLKPWKQSYRETDVTLFYTRLKSTWISFIQLNLVSGINSDDFHSLYFGKAAINDQRRATGY